MTIVWSEKAEKDFDKILGYLESEWGKQSVENFTKLTEDLLMHISNSPEMFPSAYSKKKNIRRALITPHNRLYYRIDKNQILLLTIFDTRQHPSKLKLK